MTQTTPTTDTNMRTMLYIHEPSTVTIQPTNPADSNIALYRYNRPETISAVRALKLEPGIYMVLSKYGIQVSTGGVEVHSERNDKDDPPRPPAGVLALEPGATQDSVAKFFSVALGL